MAQGVLEAMVPPGRRPPKRDLRRLAVQSALGAGLLCLVWFVVTSTQANLAARGIATGFGFLDRPAGFDLAFSLLPFSAASPIWMALAAGIANTLFLARMGALCGTLLGLLVAALRLSPNLAAARLAAAYIGLFRNTPVLLHLSFWYFAVFARLPPIRDGFTLGGWGFLNNRGLYLPAPALHPWVALVSLAGLVAPSVLGSAIRRRAPTSYLGRVELCLLAGVVLLASAIGIGASGWNIPVRGGLGIRGGFDVVPELLAAITAISVYSSAFIAELLRGAILSVDRGQTEAAQALGLSKRVLMRKVILPQAFRLVMPPLTSQYVNLVKQTAIVASIGFPDLMLIFGKTVLTQTGQAIEVLALVAAVYLSISLLAAGAIHLYARRLVSQGIGR